jgi:hypothetical protein
MPKRASAETEGERPEFKRLTPENDEERAMVRALQMALCLEEGRVVIILL